MSDTKGGPESQYLHKLKRGKVRIKFHNGNALQGTLAWVDRYTVGLVIISLGKDEETREVMFYKAGIASIEGW